MKIVPRKDCAECDEDGIVHDVEGHMVPCLACGARSALAFAVVEWGKIAGQGYGEVVRSVYGTDVADEVARLLEVFEIPALMFDQVAGVELPLDAIEMTRLRTKYTCRFCTRTFVLGAKTFPGETEAAGVYCGSVCVAAEESRRRLTGLDAEGLGEFAAARLEGGDRE